MNDREKKLSWILAAIVILGVGGGGFWYGFYSPYSEIQSQIALLEEENDRQEKEMESLENKNESIFTRHPRLKEWKSISLPVQESEKTDVKNRHIAALKLDYTGLLMDLLMRNGFKPATTTVKTQERADLRQVPILEGKKPAYTAYQFEIVGLAKLEELAGFLQQLHQIPLLHHVSYVKLEKTNKNQAKGDLKITLHVEGLMVADANKKPKIEVEKLLAVLKKPKEKELVLAPTKRDYSVLGPVNPFFPPDPPVSIVRVPTETPTIKPRPPTEDPEEVLSAVKLTTITGDGKKWEAYLYDQNRGGRETKIRPSAAWSDFSVKDKYDNEVLKAKLLHIDPSFILFQSGDEVYMMRCGETLYPSIANPIDKEGLKSRGLEKFFPVKTKPASGKEKSPEKDKIKKDTKDKTE